MTDSDTAVPEATAELLLTLADDEFVLGFWDSEWTGIAPMLEEDVATSSIAQDEIGHAKAWYELLAQMTDDDADRIAFGREAEAYRHAALMNHPRTDWAFTVVRRFLYETADALRLEVLATSSDPAIAGLAGKMRREETYHLLHWSAWMRRLAENRRPGHGSRPPWNDCGPTPMPCSRRSPVRRRCWRRASWRRTWPPPAGAGTSG
jgi:ring-1,2-phenylacetyl-CoA epoxidase subunit PaaC